jgi:hypothetical protein
MEYAPCRPIAAGIYQVTIYAKNALATDGLFGTFNIKFFDQQGWSGAEETSTNYTVSSPLIARTDVGNVGNVGGTTTPFEGIYQITLNQNDKTIKTVKIQ